MQETPAADGEPRSEGAGEHPEGPWQSLARLQDRRLYLRVVAQRRGGGKDRARRIGPAGGVRRQDNSLLGAPASITRIASTGPAQQDVRNYLRHSADLTMRGGNAVGLVYPLAACSLAEHYVFRRIAGSSSGALAAAATAAAELGRGAPDPAPAPQAPGVVPGFAGLAAIVGWLAGSAPAVSPDGGRGTPGSGAGPELYRIARLLQPAAQTRGLYRLLVAALRAEGFGPALALRLVLAAVPVLSVPARVLLGLVWAGLILGWLGLTGALISGSRAEAITPWVSVGASVMMLLALLLAGIAVTVVVELLSASARLRTAEQHGFGLVPGAEEPAERSGRKGAGRLSRWLDRRGGLPGPAAATAAADPVPPLFSWLGERLDDLAGIPAGDARPALTLGDLWRGSVCERTAADGAQLEQAALDPQHRVIDLELITTDLSGRRAYRLPFASAERAERLGGARFLFCETCLAGLLPERVVTQMIKAAPSTDTDHPCPRHPAGVLRELPEPWDLPVLFAVRLSFSPPGLLSAVPLYSIETQWRPARYDQWGAELAPAPPVSGQEPTVARTHWFSDGGLTANVTVSHFDALLARWPTFAISLEDADSGAEEVLRLPAQDASAPRRSWRPIGSASSMLSALLDTGLGHRDSAQADQPGFRGRVALLRRSAAERGDSFLIPQATVLAIALRGLHAGRILRERFTGSDDLVPGQTLTDRYRWIRLRLALREYRGLSLQIGARLPLYRDLASSYHVPEALTAWFDPPLPAAERDPIWADAASAVLTLRAMSTGGVLDFDADRGAAPGVPQLRLLPPE